MTDEAKKDPDLDFLSGPPTNDEYLVTEIWERDEAGEWRFVGYKRPGEPVTLVLKL